MKTYVGTSGFSYKSWGGDFYPADLPAHKQLEYYAGKFDSVEINASFYRLPKEQTLESWRNRVPAGFRFSIKGSRYITHRIRLKDIAPHVELFFSRTQAMGDKLGVVLWQLPPILKFDHLRAAAFFNAVSRYGGGVRQALEVRHESWFEDEACELMRRHAIALVIAHSNKWPYRDDTVTADFLYARFHGAPELYASDYSDDELKDWAGKLKHLADGRDIYAYFNNDANVRAPQNAATLAALLAD